MSRYGANTVPGVNADVLLSAHMIQTKNVYSYTSFVSKETAYYHSPIINSRPGSVTTPLFLFEYFHHHKYENPWRVRCRTRPDLAA